MPWEQRRVAQGKNRSVFRGTEQANLAIIRLFDTAKNAGKPKTEKEIKTMASKITRTMVTTKANLEGFNRKENKVEQKKVTLFTEPEGELEILRTVSTADFIAYRALEITTTEEQREMSVEHFYRNSKAAGTLKGKKVSRTVTVTKANIDGFNRAENKVEQRGFTLFTEPQGELDILKAVTTDSFIAFHAVSIDTKEEQREMTVSDFYRLSKAVPKKEKEQKEEAAQ